WMQALANRYVMEEERAVLQRIMDMPTPVAQAAAPHVAHSPVAEPSVEAVSDEKSSVEVEGVVASADAESVESAEIAVSESVGVAAADSVPVEPVAADAAQPAVIELVDRGEWPRQSDARLLQVLAEQVKESVELLQSSSESGLMKLMTLLESAPGEAVEAHVMDALGSLQNLDRVSQWVNNVTSTLNDWSCGVTAISGDAGWMQALANRYVMEEERAVLQRIMDMPTPVAQAAAPHVAHSPVEAVSVEDASVEEISDEESSPSVEEQVEVESVVDTVVERGEQEADVEQLPDPLSDETVEQVPSAPAQAAVSVTIVGDWPVEADSRLLKIVEKQVEAALVMLQESSESSLMKLMTLLEQDPGAEVEGHVMDALASLQNIDRVVQWLSNVRSCLGDWGGGVASSGGSTPWREAMLARCVMEEEREVIRAILDEDA
ncbi:MAG: hypothetical protein Q9M13_03660, partial [Mariprofundales bacterium]|nr:hypothetical protein [Mariprofundales bacterium]